MLFRQLICSFVVLLAGQAVLAQSAKSTQETQKEKPAEPDIPLKVTLSGAPFQKVKDGILFQVEVVNVSASPVSLYDPSDVMDISLVGNEGFPLALPPVTPMLSIQGGDRKKLREQLDQKRAFEVVTASMGGAEGVKTLADLDPAGEVLLAPGDKFVMTARMTRMLADAAKFIADQKAYAGKPEPKGPPPSEPEVESIRPDNYMIRVLIPFVSSGKSMGRFLISNELKVKLE